MREAVCSPPGSQACSITCDPGHGAVSLRGCGWQRVGPFTLSLAPCHAPAALGCSLRAAQVTAWGGAAWGLLTQCGDWGGGGTRGTAGLTPSPVPRVCQARTAATVCRDSTVRRLVSGRWPAGRGVCGIRLPGPQQPVPDLPQGESGRNGAPGEKGPNGLPVRARASFAVPEMGVHAPGPPSRGLCRGTGPLWGALLRVRQP